MALTHHLTRALSALAVGALATTLMATPASAVTTTEIKPGALTRGPDVTIPHLEGKTIVDGGVSIRVRAAIVRLLGKTGSVYIVATAKRDGSSGRVLRVQTDGTATVLTRAGVFQVELSADGARIVATRTPNNTRTTIVTAWSSVTGALEAQRSFRGYSNLLDANGDDVLLGTFGRRGTFLWDTEADTVRTVTRRLGSVASLTADRLASFTKDPYQGGCTVVSSISDPTTRIWTSCKERVEDFAPDGGRMATIDILSDGIGPSVVTARAVTGTAVGRYSVKGWFGELVFETSQALLLDTNGRRQAATVRCIDTDCERASDLRPSTQPRLAAAG